VFAVPAAVGSVGGTGERVVLVAEHIRTVSLGELDVPGVVRAVRGAVSARHGLRLAEILLVAPGAVARTSSGKVSRALTRARYLEGAYGRAAEPAAGPAPDPAVDPASRAAG